MAFLIHNYGVSLFVLFSLIAVLWVCLLVSRHYQQIELANCENLKNFDLQVNDVLVNDAVNQTRLNTWSGFKKFKVRNKTIESMMQVDGEYMSDVCSFELIPLETPYPLPSFKAGQHLSFQLNINGEKVVKYYSLSDSPNGHSYRVTVRRALAPKSEVPIPNGVGSNFFHDCVMEGDSIEVALPKGDFYLEEQKNDKAILICGGIGITPMVSMAKTIMAVDPNREVHIYYGVRTAEEVVLKEDLLLLAKEMPNFYCHICVSSPYEGMSTDFRFSRFPNLRFITDLSEDMLPLFNPNGKGCRVSVDLLKTEHLSDDKNQSFFLCGPPAMMASMVKQLYEWGIEKQQVHWEGFGPCAVEWPGDLLKSHLKPCQVVLQKCDFSFSTNIQWKPENGTLLSLSDYHDESKGVIPRSCGQGFCGQCKVQYIGDVHYDKETPFMAKLGEGECLPCVCKPVGDVILKI